MSEHTESASTGRHQSEKRAQGSRLRSEFLAPALLLILFAQATLSAARTSITIDEGLHITSGYTILRTGDLRLVEEHPPLVKVWAALPLLAVPGLADPRALPAWDEAAAPTTESLPLLRMTQQWLYPYRPMDRLVFPARAMTALLAALLGAVVYRWAKDLACRKEGLFALFLLACDPNILAHAAVAGTDLGAACFVTLALFCLARFLRRPTTLRLILSGVTLGLAQGSKVSAALLLPAAALLGLLTLPRRRLLSTALLLLLAGLTLWGLYGFEIGRVPGVPFPIPAASHAIPWMRLRQHMADGHAAFLLGQNSTRGWWYYFPVAFALKTPLPTLCLLAAAMVCAGQRIAQAIRGQARTNHATLRSSIHRWGPLALFPLLYGVASLFSSLNIGYRHLMPILPCLFIFISRLAPRASCFTQRTSRITHHASRITLCLLLAWLALGTICMFPHYLAYFNELAGGPDNGWRYLADSNTDWGQGYRDLARFQREHGLGAVRLSAFIFYDPAIYGVVYEPLTPLHGDTPAVFPSRFNPPPGDYVISATTLDGIPLADPEMYDWFRKREPDARIAHVLFYYHIPPQDPAPTWLAQCTAPAAPLSPQVAAEGFGRADLRRVYFDCTQAWVYPGGGRTPGWYAFYRGGETSGDFTQAFQANARLVYEQRLQHDTPPFAIYEATAPPNTPDRPVSASVRIGDLTLLGHTVRASSVIEVWTFWRVEALPAVRPLSLMLHLIGPDGTLAAVGDGLGAPVEGWQVGDILVQRHALALPPDAPAGDYALYTGVYWLDTMERWPVLQGNQNTGDQLQLSTVFVGSR